jgi:hypothetical protein
MIAFVGVNIYRGADAEREPSSLAAPAVNFSNTACASTSSFLHGQDDLE